MKNFKVCLLSLLITACGGSNNDNPPDVAGIYACVTGCLGICEYTALVVTQNKSTVVAVNDFLSCTGDVNNDGDYSASCEDASGNSQTCSGTFASELFTAKCTIDGVECQQAAFAIQ